MMNEAHIWDSCLFATFNFSFNFSPALSLLMIENFPSDEPCQSARFPHHMYSLTDFLLLIDWRLSFQFLLSPPMQTCLTPSHLLISDALTSSSPSLFKKNWSWWYYFHAGMHEPSKSYSLPKLPIKMSSVPFTSRNITWTIYTDILEFSNFVLDLSQFDFCLIDSLQKYSKSEGKELRVFCSRANMKNLCKNVSSHILKKSL